MSSKCQINFPIFLKVKTLFATTSIGIQPSPHQAIPHEKEIPQWIFHLHQLSDLKHTLNQPPKNCEETRKKLFAGFYCRFHNLSVISLTHNSYQFHHFNHTRTIRNNFFEFPPISKRFENDGFNLLLFQIETIFHSHTTPQTFRSSKET